MNQILDARSLAEGCRNGRYNLVEVVRSCLDRINEAENRLDAFLHLDESLPMERARFLSRSGPPPEGSGLLYGVPVAVKDNICVQGYPCTCGSKILEGYRPAHQATAVERIQAEGGIVVGKTNMDEFGMGSSTEFSAYRPSRNPWDTARIPGGSSGGSAAAVASGAVPLALGSDTGGSIRQPASFCGTVGFKPTYGTVSRYGLVAFASSLDQIGPLSLNVGDAALLAQVIQGHDERDSTSVTGKGPDLIDALEQDPAGLKIGIPREYLSDEIDVQIRNRVEEGLNRLAGSGVEVREISLPHTRYAVPAYYLVADSEASANLARFDGIRYGPRARQEDLVATYEATRKEGFGPEVKRRVMLGTFALSSGYYDDWYLKALSVRRLIQEDFQAAFQEVDLIAGPVSPVSAFRLGEKISDPITMYLCDILTVPASLAGIPAVSVPCGLTEERLPVGLQIMGPPLSDALVLRAARTLERTGSEPDRSPLFDQIQQSG